MACTLEDVLARRIRLLFLDVSASLEVAPTVCKLIQSALGKNESWYEQQLEEFKKLAKNYLPDQSL